MGNLRKMILGEKMPDKEDPRYREKYEKDVEAGRKFARATGIDRLAGHVQKFAGEHRGLFLGVVMAIVLGCFVLNAVHFARAYRLRQEHRKEAKAPVREMDGNEHTVIPIQEKENGTDPEE